MKWMQLRLFLKEYYIGTDKLKYVFEDLKQQEHVGGCKAERKVTHSEEVWERKAKESDSEVVNDNDEEEEEDEKMDESEDKRDINKEDSKDVEKAENKKSESDSEVQKNAQCNGSDSEEGSGKVVNSRLSPPKPETAPVVAPLTVEDVIKLDTSSIIKASDNDSLIVNPDDTQSDIDSSVNEKDSVNDEPVQEESQENAAQSDSKSSGRDATTEGDSEEKHSPKEESVAKDDESNANNVSSENANSTEKTSESSPATDKQKSSADVAKSSEKDSSKKADSSTKKSSRSTSSSGENVKRVSASGKNLWVSGLAEKTRANDLKSLFSKFGKVLGAKIVTNARTPGARCYGFITMNTSEEALVCIEKLNHTELHGRIITVEKTTKEPSGTIKRGELRKKGTSQKASTGKSEAKEKTEGETKETAENAESAETAEEKEKGEKQKSAEKSDDKDVDVKSKDGTEETKEGEKKEGKKRTPSKEKELRAREKSRDRKRLRGRRSRSRDRGRPGFRGGFFRRGYGRGFGSRRPFMSRFMDRYHRDRIRDRDHDSDRRRFSDIIRQREIERKNREESIRLERERERLRIEREKLERERAEVLRLEREKQRMERERLERERAELRKRTQMTLEDRRGSKRGFEGPRKDIDPYWEDRKRHAGPRREPSLDSPTGFGEFGRDRGAFSDRRGDRFEGRAKGGDISPTFNSSGRREGRHEHVEERPAFHRGNRNARDTAERGGRDEWKGKQTRDRGFDRPGRNNFNERGRNFDRPHPWEGGPPDRDQNKFGNNAQMGNSQWVPVNKMTENWGRMDQPPQERWGAMDSRVQPGMNMGPPNVGHPPNQIGMFGNAGGNEMMNPIAGHFCVDRFNTNSRRF
ncbi:SAFB-like transcription modulator [Stegodyphus dumicola]|uniref:SAFB-like transcription modulator n=1 Tax=Stegodyphus dumicola TaxID=202533 RepID=UPI0015A8DD0A|nr:SAFB-like transcription modulator [Stegodyphus dumicola]